MQEARRQGALEEARRKEAEAARARKEPPAPAEPKAAEPKSVEAAPKAQPPSATPDMQRRSAAPEPAPPADWDVVPVFYGTDRVRKEQEKRFAYTGDRARRLELGRALVTVPKSHQVPNIERPFAIRVPYTNITLYEQAEDPKQHFTVQELKSLTREEFIALCASAHLRRQRLQGPGRGVRARLQHRVRLRPLPHGADGLRPQVRRRGAASTAGRPAAASPATITTARAPSRPSPTCASSSSWS